MAKYTISQFTMPDGDIIELKDKSARDAIAGGTFFLGVTETELTDGSTTTQVSIGADTLTVKNGDIVVCGNKEYIYAESDMKWHELGDVTDLGALALKDSAIGVYTPGGTVSKPNVVVTGNAINITEFATPGHVTNGVAASCTLPTLTFTPDGSTENLTIGWTPGSFVANTPTAVTLPTAKNTAVLNGATAALDEAPIFTGTLATITVS